VTGIKFSTISDVLYVSMLMLASGGDGALQVNDSIFHNNQASMGGGAIQASDRSNIVLVNTTISSCSARSGGGINARGVANVTITQHSVIDGCSAESVSDTHCVCF